MRTVTGAVRVDPENLPVGAGQALGVRGVRRVAHRDVEQAVLAELELAAVVIAGHGPPDQGEDTPATARIRDVWIRAHPELVDVDVANACPRCPVVVEE